MNLYNVRLTACFTAIAYMAALCAPVFARQRIPAAHDPSILARKLFAIEVDVDSSVNRHPRTHVRAYRVSRRSDRPSHHMVSRVIGRPAIKIAIGNDLYKPSIPKPGIPQVGTPAQIVNAASAFLYDKDITPAQTDNPTRTPTSIRVSSAMGAKPITRNAVFPAIANGLERGDLTSVFVTAGTITDPLDFEEVRDRDEFSVVMNAISEFQEAPREFGAIRILRDDVVQDIDSSVTENQVWVDGQAMGVSVPCAVIAHEGRHKVRIVGSHGGQVEFTVDVLGETKVDVMAHPDAGHWSISAGNNPWFAKFPVEINSATGEKKLSFQGFGSSTEVRVIAPVGSTISWNVAYENLAGEQTSLKYEDSALAEFTLPRNSVFTLTVLCTSGGGQMTIYCGEKLIPPDERW